jgi:hypothetical protein
LSSRTFFVILGLFLGFALFLFACFNAGMSWINGDYCAQVEMAAVAYMGHEPKETVRDLILGACRAAGDYYKVASQLEECLSFSVERAVSSVEDKEETTGESAREGQEKKTADKVESEAGEKAGDKKVDVAASEGEAGEKSVTVSDRPSAILMMRGLADSYADSPEILAITGCLLRNREDVDSQTIGLLYLKRAQALGLVSLNLYADIANALSYLSDVDEIDTVEAKEALQILKSKYGITKGNYDILRLKTLEEGVKKFPHSSLLLYLTSDYALHEAWSCSPPEINRFWKICKKDAGALVIEQAKLKPSEERDGQGDAKDVEDKVDVDGDVADNVDGAKGKSTSSESVEEYYPNYYVRGLLMRGYATAMLGDVKTGEKDVLRAVSDMLKIAEEEQSDSGKKEAHLWLARYYWDVGQMQKARAEYLKVKALPEAPAEEGTFIYSSNAESLESEWQTFCKQIK